MKLDLKSFRNAILDPTTPSSEIRRLFCQLIRNYPRHPVIIQALGLLYAHRSHFSQPPKDDAQRIFRKILLPLLERSNTLVPAFYTMIVDPYIPSICILAVINALKRSGRDPWWLIGAAVNLRPSLADRIFHHRGEVAPNPQRRRSRTK